MGFVEWLSLVYFSSLTALASWFRFEPKRRRQAVGLGFSGILATLFPLLLARVVDSEWTAVFRDWMPALILLLAYWQAGRFFVGPNKKLQNKLRQVDEILGQRLRLLRAVSEWVWIGWILELAYLLAYLIVPLSLALLYLSGLSHRADYFWAVVLGATYPCYAALAFFPTLPPRFREGAMVDTFRTKNRASRKLNLWILNRFGIGANTFPSGHVAATSACALVLFRETPQTGILFVILAIGVALSVVVRRYHYVLDAVLAILWATVVWFVVGIVF